MLERFKNTKSLFALSFISVICVIVNTVTFPQNILAWDVFGYYLYLPLAVIYNDLGMSDFSIVEQIIERYKNTPTFYQGMQMPSGDWVIKYSMGLAFLYLPFFAIGHIVALLSSFPTDGFSLPYQYSIWFGGILYTLAGLVLVRRLALKFFSDFVSALILIILYLGTNYLMNTSFYGQNAMSHNYLFTLYLLLILITIRWHKSPDMKYMILLGIIAGIIILSRPSEIVCLTIPLFWGVYNLDSLTQKIRLLVKNYRQVLIFACLLLFIGSFQFAYWKAFTGKFLFYTYGINPGEGFECLRPYIVEVLFSFRKGWLLYTPVMVFALVGIALLYKQNKSLFTPVLIYFSLNLYLVSCWSTWWYAESFGQRALVPSYALLILPLGYTVQWINSSSTKFRRAMFVLIGILSCLNLFQTWQYHTGLIHGSRMSMDYYISVFGRTGIAEEDKKLLLIDRSFDGKEQFVNENEYNKKVLEVIDFESLEGDGINSKYAYSGKTSFQLDENEIYSPASSTPYSELTDHYYAWIRGSVMVFPIVDPKSNPTSFVICFEHNGYSYKYKALDFEGLNLKLNEWNVVTLDYLTPEVRNVKDLLKVYVWHRGKDKIFVDDIKVEVFEPKQSMAQQVVPSLSR